MSDLELRRSGSEGHVRHRPGAVRPLHACGIKDVVAMNFRVGQPQGLVDPALQGPCERGQVGLAQVVDPTLQGEVRCSPREPTPRADAP